jgi:hypothetical protein
VKVSAERFVTRAVTTAKRSPRDAVRALFKGLFAGNDLNPLTPAQWEMLSALAERATAVHRGPPPVAAKPLGDDWFECPACGDAFEGTRTACTCGVALGTGAAALEIDLGDVRMTMRPSRADELGYMGRLGYLATAFEGLRIEHGARWFELVDDQSRTLDRANARAVLPPNLVPIGVYDDDAIVLAHETKLDVYTLDANGDVTRDPDRVACAAEIIVRQIAIVSKI